MDNNFSPIEFNKGERLSVYIQPNSNSVIVSGYDKKIDISLARSSGKVLFDKKKELLKANATSMDASINNSILTISQSDENVKLEQRAYAASRVDYEKPSLEAIGTGEGMFPLLWYFLIWV